MRQFLPFSLSAAVALAGASAAQEAAPAPPPDRGGIEEITITAEKRETNLQDTPIAVTAITSEAIEEQGLEDFNDIQFVAPALVYGEIADMAQITMRGIGVDISTIDAEPGVALHQDGVYRGGLVSSSALFFDAERVEVLRGPQGTLYGRNSTGGSLNVITKLPGERPSLDVSTLYGDYSRWRAEAFGDVPLIDGILALRGGFSYDSRGGYTKNTNTGNEEDDARYRQAKLAALLTPTEDLEVALRFNWLRSEVGGAPFIKTADTPVAPLFISGSNPGGILNFPGVCDPTLTCTQVFGLTLSPPGFPTGNPRKVNYEGDQNYYRDNWDVNATVSWNATDDIAVKWISSYLDLDQDLDPFNNDGIPIQLLVGDYEQSNEEWSQEIDVSGSAFDERLDWIFGFFYYDSHIFEEYRYTLPALQATYEAIFGIFGGGPPLPPGSLALLPFANPVTGVKLDGTPSPVPFLEFSLDQDLTSWALFTQQTFHVTEAVRLTGGFRWTKDQKVDVHSQVLNLSPVPAGCRDQRSTEEWSSPTGKLGVDMDVAESTLLYATYTRGFKAGGYNVGSCDNTYDPEYVNAYEAGVKTQLFENTLQVNVSTFFNDYTDLQVRKFVNNAAIVSNAATAETYGVEVEALWVPLEPLRIESSLSILHARFTEYADVDPIFPGLGPQDLRGNALLRAPEWKFTLAGQYTLGTGSAGDFTFRGEYAYTSEQFHTVFNNDFGRQAPYNIGNLRLIWNLPEDRLAGVTFQAFVENIGDVDYVTNHAPNATSGSTISTYAPPRTWGVQLRYAWDAE
ncbi:MAG: TonB-dependent receptor [Myxococcota bacterium]